MKIYRCTRFQYEATAFRGDGARQGGGRWNSKGNAAVYASESAALAALEILVGLQDGDTLKSYVLLEAEIPDEEIQSLNLQNLPESWRDSPVSPALQAIGDEFLATGAMGLLVPSAVLEGSNVLMNPAHPLVKTLQTNRCARQIDARLNGLTGF